MKSMIALAAVGFVSLCSAAHADSCMRRNSLGTVVNPFCESQRGHHHNHGHPSFGVNLNFNAAPCRHCQRRQRREVVVVQGRRPAPRPQAEWGAKDPTSIACADKPRGFPFQCGGASPTGLCICP